MIILRDPPVCLMVLQVAERRCTEAFIAVRNRLEHTTPVSYTHLPHAKLVILNREETPFDGKANLVIRGDLCEALTAVSKE